MRLVAAASRRAGGPAAGRPGVRERHAFVGTAVAHPRSRRTPVRRMLPPTATAAPAPPPPQFVPPTAASSPSQAAEQGEAAPAAFDWADHWYPVAFVKDIPDKEPYSFRLLDQPMRVERGVGRCGLEGLGKAAARVF